MLTKDEADDLRSLLLAPASSNADSPVFVVNSTSGHHADVMLSSSGEVLLTVWGRDPLFPEGWARFSAGQVRELCVALLTVAALAEGG